jgi:pyruvate kinase
MLPKTKTKIVCTIGPASQSPSVLRAMLAAGMNVARLNFAHGDFATHLDTMNALREAARETGQRLTIMGDLPGPKMRVGQLADEPIVLQRDQLFSLYTTERIGDKNGASISFPGLPQAVKPGDKIFVNDGYIQLLVNYVHQERVDCQVQVGGELLSNKGVNFPGIDLGIAAFTPQDHDCLRFAAEHKLDAISQSFVQRPEDLRAVRQAAAELDYHPFLIAKIERGCAVDRLPVILAEADGIMVARGDLGVEIPIEEIALVQKQLITQANLAGKPVITATQMLESMVAHNRPTRAEATDVANAILDGTDCLMLSGETAMGQFPVESIAVMSRIAQVVEDYDHQHDVPHMLEQARERGDISNADLISLSIYMTVTAVNPIMVVTPTLSGNTARKVCRFRPKVWIVAVSPNEATCQDLQFSYGVHPVHETERPQNWETYVRSWLERHEFREGLVVMTTGHTTAATGGTNRIEIIDLLEPTTDRRLW